ncbi:MAG TPA: DNA (cytosine-5-)-methyltransferase [Planctomycetota bacterium]|nr:DNA (cytosine-5-)-methyltransferase [Planctomycetota bacterium]
MGLKVVGLFAGIGGLERGFELAGHTTRLLVENDPAASKVLAAHFPRCKRHGDIRTLPSLPRGTEVVTAGFPCQDLSQAGRTTGIFGTKSSLVHQVFRLLRDRPVEWVVLENVPFMLQLACGKAMDIVVSELEQLGYRWAYRVVDSMAFGLPQRRRRVFLVASRSGDPTNVLMSDEVRPREDKPWHPDLPVGFYWTEGNRGVGWAVESVPTLKGGSGFGIPSPPAVLLPSGLVVTPSLGAAEELQGFERGWTAPAAEAGLGKFCWRMVGNAVGVRTAKWLGRRLASPGKFSTKRIGDPIGPGTWPRAACNLGDGAREVEIGEWPAHRELADIERLMHDCKPLSARATRGFVTRARRAVAESRLRLPIAFLDALTEHLDRIEKETPSATKRAAAHCA